MKILGMKRTSAPARRVADLKEFLTFLCDEEYREECGAKRHLGTLGAEKLKIT